MGAYNTVTGNYIYNHGFSHSNPILSQSYRLLVAFRLYWLPYPGLLGKEVQFSAILGRSLLEVAKWKR
jgi:hypothetical protein